MAANSSPSNNNNPPEPTKEDLQKLESWLIPTESGRKPAVVKFRACTLSGTPSLQVGKVLNLSFKSSQSDTWLIQALLSAHGLGEVSQTCNDYNLLWTGSHPRPHTFSGLRSYQRVNHFPRSYELTRKDRLYKNVARLQHCHGAKHFDFLPASFVMPTEYRDFWSAHHRLHGPWIVKPVASSRGRGIYLVSKPEEVPLEEPVLVSKYIANPLLVDGHKCDLRLYVVVTSYDPLVIYLYRHGIVRFAAVKYTADQSSLDNPCIHLCNYSINKYHADFVVSEDPSVEDVGHKRSLTGFLKWLRSQGKDVNRLMRRIEDVVIKSIMAATPPVAAACKMFVPHRNNCFELYGFDILIDEDMKPWLLEVNLSPSLGCDSPIDLRVKSSMLADLLTLVGVPAVDPTTPSAVPAAPSTSSRQGRARTAPTERNQYRRAQSADTGPGRSRLQSSRCNVKLTGSASTLTAEESRILTQLRDDFERRGDFNRIFPSEDSWSLYGDLIETLNSSPALASPPGVNFNRVVHERLFPLHLQLNQRQNNNTNVSLSSMSSTTSTMSSRLPPRVPTIKTRSVGRASASSSGRWVQSATAPVRIQTIHWAHPNWRSLNEESDAESPGSTGTSFYEEAILQPLTIENHRSERKLNKKGSSSSSLDSPLRVKKEIQHQLDNRHVLSQEQSRRGFSRYLRYVQQRLPGLENSPDGANQLDLIERFLQRLGSAGRIRSASPSQTKSPIKKLVGADRVASVASKLGEFLDRYEQVSTTHHHSDCEGGLKELKMVNSDVFDDFLRLASEKEIEDVLCKHSKNAPCSHFLSGRCHPRSSGRSSGTESSVRSSTNSSAMGTNNANRLGLLREVCYSSSTANGRPQPILRTNSILSNSHHGQHANRKSKEELVDLSGRSSTSNSAAGSVVTFDLRGTATNNQHHRRLNNSSGHSQRPLRPSSLSRVSILKREKSM